MAEKMDKQPAAAAAPSLPLLPLSVEKPPQQQPRAARAPFLDVIDVQFVNRWTYLNGVFFLAFGVFYYTVIVTSDPGDAASWLRLLLPRAATATATATKKMTPGTALEMAINVLSMGLLWCSMPLAAAGALALLLPRRRWRARRAAAHVALALTVASHCMLAAVTVTVLVCAGLVGLFFDLLVYGSIFVNVVLDLLCYLALRSSVENGEQIDQFSNQAAAASSAGRG